MTRRKHFHVQALTESVQRWRHYWARWLVFGVFTLLLVIACSGNTSQDPAPQSQKTPSGNCRLVKHDAGETTICGHPQRIAALSPRMLDPMLALGIQPAACALMTSLNLRKFDNPGKQIPILGEQVTTQPINLGNRNTPSLEALTLLNPDLIIGQTSQANELFSKIAPTLLLETESGKEQWLHRLRVLAQAFDREEQAEQIIAKHNQQVAEVRATLTPVAAAYPRVLNITTNQRLESILFNPSGGEFLEALGFQSLLLEQYPEEQQAFSLEALSQLDPDLIIVGTSGQGNDDYHSAEIVKQRWEQTPVLQSMRAVREGRVYFVYWLLINREGPITEKFFLEKLPELLLPALETRDSRQNHKPL